jgi:hypothetical protein
MVNNSTNRKSSHFSPQIIEQKKDNDLNHRKNVKKYHILASWSVIRRNLTTKIKPFKVISISIYVSNIGERASVNRIRPYF